MADSPLLWRPSAQRIADAGITRYQHWLTLNKGLTFSMADRRDMLIQLGSDRREEIKGAIRLMGKSEEAKSIADRARADGYRVPPHPLGWDVGADR
jgi:hypothetical protein